MRFADGVLDVDGVVFADAAGDGAVAGDDDPSRDGARQGASLQDGRDAGRRGRHRPRAVRLLQEGAWRGGSANRAWRRVRVRVSSVVAERASCAREPGSVVNTTRMRQGGYVTCTETCMSTTVNVTWRPLVVDRC